MSGASICWIFQKLMPVMNKPVVLNALFPPEPGSGSETWTNVLYCDDEDCEADLMNGVYMCPRCTIVRTNPDASEESK
jgi:hypothetical protein